MGAAYEAPEMSAAQLERAIKDNSPYIENINFRGIKMPDSLHGCFNHCTFNECDFSEAVVSATFLDCSFYDMETKGMLVQNSWFQKSTVANTKFEDCKLANSVFSLSDLRQCSAVRTSFENCDFNGGTMDRVFFHQGIKAQGIVGLETVNITMGGATEQEVSNHARQIREALLYGTLNKTEVVNFRTPIHVDDEDFSTECKNFVEYAKAMQLPDPTYVVMPMDTQNLVTTLVNDGKVDAFEALSTVAFNFQYDAQGREYIEFPKPEEMRTLLKSCKSYKEESVRMADQLAEARKQAEQEHSENREDRGKAQDVR